MKKICSCGSHLASHEATFEIIFKAATDNEGPEQETCIPADFNCSSGGDQLTIMRFTYGCKLPTGAHTFKDQLEHCQRLVTEFFHTKQVLFTVITTIQHMLYTW